MTSELPVLLLAGGKSSRMGHPKGLVLFEARPWIETQLTRLARCGLREAIVVLGYHSEIYFEELLWLKDARSSPDGIDAFGLKVRCVVNPLPEFGPFSSIQAGARLSSRGAWILPIDVPCPSPAVWELLSTSKTPVCVPTHQGRGGHPVRLSQTFLNRLAQIPPDSPDSRLDHQIRQAGTDVERIEVEDALILKNLNSPRDWS